MSNDLSISRSSMLSLQPSPFNSTKANFNSPSVGLVGFFENRSLRRLFGMVGLGSTALVLFYIYRKIVERASAIKREKEELAKQLQQEQMEKANPLEVDPKKEESNLVILIPKEPEIPKVVLYQVPRGYFTPAVAPFALKLETFMRIAKVPYKVYSPSASDHAHEVDTPWIKIGDNEIKNNYECLAALKKIFNIDLNKDVSKTRKAAASFVEAMLESKVYWAVALWRWVYDGGNSLKAIQPIAPIGEEVLLKVQENIKKSAHYHGIGQKSEEEVISETIEILNYLATALGRHKYFLGDTPGVVDSTAFSIFAQMLWNMPGSPFEVAIKQHKQLIDYIMRMRTEFWPDWNELVHQPEEKNQVSQEELPPKPMTAPASTKAEDKENANVSLWSLNVSKSSTNASKDSEDKDRSLGQSTNAVGSRPKVKHLGPNVLRTRGQPQKVNSHVTQDQMLQMQQQHQEAQMQVGYAHVPNRFQQVRDQMDNVSKQIVVGTNLQNEMLANNSRLSTPTQPSIPNQEYGMYNRYSSSASHPQVFTSPIERMERAAQIALAKLTKQIPKPVTNSNSSGYSNKISEVKRKDSEIHGRIWQ